LHAKHLSNVGKGGIVGKGFLTKLNDRECAQQDQSNVEQEARHVRLANLHGMDLKKQEANAKLETALDGGE
jgi:hypothetical protein